jgi:hypothetical protein
MAVRGQPTIGEATGSTVGKTLTDRFFAHCSLEALKCLVNLCQAPGARAGSPETVVPERGGAKFSRTDLEIRA